MTAKRVKTVKTVKTKVREPGTSRVQLWGGTSLAVTIPIDVCKALRLKQGSAVKFELVEADVLCARMLKSK